MALKNRAKQISIAAISRMVMSIFFKFYMQVIANYCAILGQ